jgi:hypothetical protein
MKSGSVFPDETDELKDFLTLKQPLRIFRPRPERLFKKIGSSACCEPMPGARGAIRQSDKTAHR